MTPGRDAARGEVPLIPSRPGRDRGRPESDGVSAHIDDADLQRGLAAAVLAALGRMQLKLDALTRHQNDGFLALGTRLAELEARVAAADDARRQMEQEVRLDPPTDPERDLRPLT